LRVVSPKSYFCILAEVLHLLADRLKDYIRVKGIQPNQRIFPIGYEAAREMVAKAGSVVGIISGHTI